MSKENPIENRYKLIDKIKDVLKEHKVIILADYKLDNKYYLITNFMIISYDEKEEHIIDIAFHVETRPDIASFLTLMLIDFDEIKNINVMEVYMKDENGKILTGNKCVELYQKNLRKNIINNFIEEQTQLQYLQTSYAGDIC